MKNIIIMKNHSKKKKVIFWYILLAFIVFLLCICAMHSLNSIHFNVYRYSAANVSATALNSDGSVLAGGTNNGHCILWNTKTRKQLRILYISNCYPSVLAFHPTKTWLLACDTDRIIKLFDFVTGDELCEYNTEFLCKCTTQIIRAIFTPDGKSALIAVRTYEEEMGLKIFVLNLESMELEFFGFKLNDYLSYAIAVNSNETKIAVDSFILDFKTQKVIQKISHGNGIFDLFFLPDFKRIVTSAGITSLNPYNIAIWDIESGKQLKGYNHLHAGHHIRDMVMVQGGHLVLSSGDDGTICLWEIETGKKIWSRRVWESFQQIAVSQDGSKGAATTLFGPIDFDIPPFNQ
jgi:WD40 repeat protein